MKLTPQQLKQIISEEVQKIKEEAELDPTADIDKLKSLKLKEAQIRAIKAKAERALEKLKEAKAATTKKLLKKI